MKARPQGPLRRVVLRCHVMIRHGFRVGLALVLVGLVGCQEAPTKAGKEAPAAPAATTAIKAAAGLPPVDECPHASAGKSCDHGAAQTGDNKHFGGKFTIAEHRPLSSSTDAAAGEGEVVRVSGKVASVCKKAGCWMVLEDGDVKARVFTKQNRIFLPQHIVGKVASVEGKLQARQVTERFAKHLEQDRGGDPSKVKGPSQALMLYASVVELM